MKLLARPFNLLTSVRPGLVKGHCRDWALTEPVLSSTKGSVRTERAGVIAASFLCSLPCLLLLRQLCRAARSVLMTVAVLSGLVFAAPAAADAADAVKLLENFVERTHSFQADFSQLIQAQSGRRPQSASGRLAFQKPGKFRWELQQPYPQLMVGDGKRVWIHDPDLQQVTVKKMDHALGSTPAALLAGNRDLLRNFELSATGPAEGLDWVEARPRQQESGFERMRLGFAPNGDLRAMQLFDNFGQTTTLRFHQPQRNPSLAPGLFQFSPPPGADVIGE